MKEFSLQTIMSHIPPVALLAGVALIFLGLGLLLAKKIWGKNIVRLKAALDDSAYLAGQWATLGISQSQLVEKLGRKLNESFGHTDQREISLRAEIQERENTVKRLETQVEKIEQSRSALSEREVEALQMQVQEVQRRDERIETLETRIQHLDSQNLQNVDEHKKQVQVLLDRISTLEEDGGGQSDEEIKRNNKQLTQLLEQRCRELEVLRDEFHNKEKALNKLKEQNATLKKGVDDLVAGWSQKKGEVAELGQLKTRLAETTDELNRVRRDFEMREVEIDMLQSESSKNSDIPADIAEAKLQNDEVREELSRTSAQVDMLLDVIENRDRRVEELEAQLSSGSKNQQISALSQTIADLQNKVTDSEDELTEIKNEARELKELIVKHNEELEERDLQLTILKSRLGEEAEDLPELVSSVSEAENRIISEAKGIGKRLTKFRSGEKSMVYFGENSAFIKSESVDLIKEVAKEVNSSGCQISLLGYSENEGNDDFNDTLSKRRADAVKERLQAEGVDDSLVIVSGKGEDADLSGTSDSWKARRVEMVLLPVAEIVN